MIRSTRDEIRLIRNIRLFCVLAVGIILLPACGKTRERRDTLAEEGAVDISSDFEYHHVTKAENGYYFWERMSENQLYPRLMFMDKESGRVVPLCNKPDCTHSNEDCNARFPDLSIGEDGVVKEYIQYYDGELYAIGLSSDSYVSLFCIQADGSEWEIDTKLYRTDYAATGHWKNPEILFDDGYVYFVDHKQKKMKLERVPIGGGTAETLFEGDENAVEVQIYRIKSNEKSVFFQVNIYPNENIEYVEGGLYQYDKVNEECSIVRENLMMPYSVWNEWVYYGGSEGICRCSIDGRTIEAIGDHQPIEVPNITLTEEYIILCDHMGDGGLIIFDYEGTPIAVVSDELKPTWYFGGDSEKLFAECVCENKTKLCYLDLTRPLDELQWEELKAD